MANYVVFLAVPGLRPSDVGPATPTLARWAAQGALAELTPTFPCVTSTVQASMWTGLRPDQHGVIANGFFHRDRAQVEFWVARNGIIQGEQIWEALSHDRPDATSAVWHAQNIKDAAADFIVTPAPIHEPDGSTKLWCYSKPDGLYQQMLDDGLGHFPLHYYWGPLAGIQSSQWILQAARWLIERQRPNFHWIYLPHLDYASQKFGPNSLQAAQALVDLDAELTSFDIFLEESMGSEAVVVVASEYAMTEVTGPIYPNRILREAGLLAIDERDGPEHIDLASCRAFAMVDHQLAHVYCRDQATADEVARLFSNVDGVAGAYAGNDRAQVGLDHPRSGEVVLVARLDRWFAYYWWLDDDRAPGFARTVDIHAKPGYDAVELFFDPVSKSIPLDASLVKGSHGAPVTEQCQRAALICSRPTALIEPGGRYRDTDMKRLVLELFKEDS